MTLLRTSRALLAGMAAGAACALLLALALPLVGRGRTVTGFKSILLKPIDPLFRRDGAGTVLPINITGTVDMPAFGVDMKRVLNRN